MTRGRCDNESISGSDMRSNSWAVMTEVRVWVEGVMMPTSFAIAVAVMMWSPVSMWTTMPARWHSWTAPRDSARGGS